MFGRKKKPQRVLRIWNAHGSALYEGPLQAFVLPETVVLDLSMEYFGDPEPCHIHRSAVHSRVCLELCEACEGQGPVVVGGLPKGIKACFAAYQGANEIEIELDN